MTRTTTWLASGCLALALPFAAASSVAAGNCSPASIKIKSLKARFVDACSRKSCPQLRGVAVLTNSCDEPIGIQLKIIGLDAAGSPVAAHDFWPASIDNIPPGNYTFSLDYALEHDPRMKSFTLEPISVRRWRPR